MPVTAFCGGPALKAGARWCMTEPLQRGVLDYVFSAGFNETGTKGVQIGLFVSTCKRITLGT